MLLITSRATSQQISELREEYDLIVKIAVDIEQQVLVGGGELHADCERQLLANGSKQENIWGAKWFPELKKVVCESIINAPCKTIRQCSSSTQHFRPE